MTTIERETRTGKTKRVGDYEITPQTRVFKLQLPGKHAGLIWNRPQAINIRMPDGQEKVLPVRDVTRIAIWSMLLGGLLGVIIIGLMYRQE